MLKKSGRLSLAQNNQITVNKMHSLQHFEQTCAPATATHTQACRYSHVTFLHVRVIITVYEYETESQYFRNAVDLTLYKDSNTYQQCPFPVRLEMHLSGLSLCPWDYSPFHVVHRIGSIPELLLLSVVCDSKSGWKKQTVPDSLPSSE